MAFTVNTGGASGCGNPNCTNPHCPSAPAAAPTPAPCPGNNCHACTCPPKEEPCCAQIKHHTNCTFSILTPSGSVQGVSSISVMTGSGTPGTSCPPHNQNVYVDVDTGDWYWWADTDGDGCGDAWVPAAKCEYVDCDDNPIECGDALARCPQTPDGTPYPTDGNGHPIIGIEMENGDEVVFDPETGIWTIPCKHYVFDADTAYEDGDAPNGDGTEADPLVFPLPQYVYVEYDPAVHGDLTDGTPDVIVGDGTTADPYQIPMCCDTIEILEITDDGGVQNADGSTTITYTIVEEDDGDGNAPTHTFEITLPGPQNFNYVPYDEAVHGPWDAPNPLVGSGTVADPYQIPLYCPSFTFTGDHDYVEGDAPDGTGTPGDPFQLPLYSFTYVEYDEAVHGDLSAPNVVGSGTTADPFQIPICCDDTTIEVLDIAITGTVTNPDGSTTITYTLTEEDDGDGNPPTHTFDVVFPPAAELNFTYVDYDTAVHDNGVVEGDGSAANPWQIPLPCCPEFTYVEYDPAVHGPLDALNPIVGDGSTADPYQIPLCCPEDQEFEYVEYDPAIHGPLDALNPIVGDGTVASPFQIPICCPEEDSWVYVEYDDTVHLPGNPPEGDGSAADPFQIPLPPEPCCEPECILPISEEHLGKTIDLSGKDGAGEKVPPTTGQVLDAPPDMYNNGPTPGASVGTNPSPIAPPYTISVPSTAGWDMIVVNVAWGRIEDANITFGSTATATADGTIGITPLTSLCNTQGFNAFGIDTTSAHQFCADVTTGAAGDILIDFPGISGGGRGLVAIEVAGYTGITCSDLLAPIDVQQPEQPLTYGQEHPSDPQTLPAGSTCFLWFGGGRHVIQGAQPSGQGTGWSEVTTSGAGTLTENSDWELALPGQDTVCQIAITNGLGIDIAAGDTITLTSTSNTGLPGNWPNHGNYCIVPIADPIAPGGVVSETCEFPDLIFDNPCEEDVEVTCTGIFDIDITTGGDDVVSAVVTFNGVQQTPITASGVYTYTETTTVGALSTGNACTMQAEIMCDNGADDTTDPATAIVVNGATLEVA